MWSFSISPRKVVLHIPGAWVNIHINCFHDILQHSSMAKPYYQYDITSSYTNKVINERRHNYHEQHPVRCLDLTACPYSPEHIVLIILGRAWRFWATNTNLRHNLLILKTSSWVAVVWPSRIIGIFYQLIIIIGYVLAIKHQKYHVRRKALPCRPWWVKRKPRTESTLLRNLCRQMKLFLPHLPRKSLLLKQLVSQSYIYSVYHSRILKAPKNCSVSVFMISVDSVTYDL